MKKQEHKQINKRILSNDKVICKENKCNNGINDKYKEIIYKFYGNKNVIPNTLDTIKVSDNSQGLGFAEINENLFLEISGETLNKTVYKKHKGKIPKELLINLKEELEEKSVLGIEGYGNNKGKVGIFVETVDINNNPIIIAVEFDKKIGRSNVVNEVVSIHGRDNIQGMLYNAYKNNAKIYTNKKSNHWLRTNGLYLPNAGSLIASICNISNSNEDVK